MIREIDVNPTWVGIIAEHVIPGMCRVGNVVGCSEQNGVVTSWRVELLTGREVRVRPDHITKLPKTKLGDLDIPAMPDAAAIAAFTVVSPTPAVRARDLERRGSVLGASMREMIEAGFSGGKL